MCLHHIYGTQGRTLKRFSVYCEMNAGIKLRSPDLYNKCPCSLSLLSGLLQILRQPWETFIRLLKLGMVTVSSRERPCFKNQNQNKLFIYYSFLENFLNFFKSFLKKKGYFVQIFWYGIFFYFSRLSLNTIINPVSKC